MKSSLYEEEKRKSHQRQVLRNNNYQSQIPSQASQEQKKQEVLKAKIATYIKTNQIEKIFEGQDYLFDKKYAEVEGFDERKELEGTLKELRNKHDQLIEHSKKKNQEINQMRDRITIFDGKEKQLQKENKETQAKILEQSHTLEKLKQKLEEAQANRKTYQFMLERMKRDQIINKVNSNNMEELLRKDQKLLGQQQEKLIQTKRQEFETRIALQKVKQNLHFDAIQREENMKKMKVTLQKKQELERKREERAKRQIEVAENAAAESKDLNERKWRNLLLVQKFLSFFLKQKMEREMGRYQVVEQAFKKIKTNTGVNDPNEIVRKYLQREQIYGQLLINIANSEKKLEQLKNDLEEQTKVKKQLNDTLMRFDKNSGQEDAEITEVRREIGSLSEKLIAKKLQKDVALEWTEKMFQKLVNAGIVPEDSAYLAYLEDGQLASAVHELLECVKAYYESVDKEDLNKVLEELEQKAREEHNELMANERTKVKGTIRSVSELNSSPRSVNSKIDSMDSN